LPVKVEPRYRERIESGTVEPPFGRFDVRRTDDVLSETSNEQFGAFESKMPLFGRTEDAFDIDYSIRPRSGTGVWHRWTVIIPRRSIAGGFIWGTVWRRTNRQQWLYKKFD
jgi:hypothetical protein